MKKKIHFTTLVVSKKNGGWLANSVDPDQMPYSAAFWGPWSTLFAQTSRFQYLGLLQ